MYKNLTELKIDRAKLKLSSTFFNDIYNAVVNAMCDELTLVEYTGPFVKTDIANLQRLGFKVEVVDVSKLWGYNNKSDMLRISWQ